MELTENTETPVVADVLVQVSQSQLNLLLSEHRKFKAENEQFKEDLKGFINLMPILVEIVKYILANKIGAILPKMDIIRKGKLAKDYISGNGLKLEESEKKEMFLNFINVISDDENVSKVSEALLKIVNRYLPVFGLEIIDLDSIKEFLNVIKINGLPAEPTK